MDVNTARSNFPALKDGYLFGDNAGGSQTLLAVADKIYDYLLRSNAQLGADYAVSALSTKRVMEDAPEDARRLFNAKSRDEIVFGFSSTQNLENLARALDGDVKKGDEIVITGEHEANGGPWKKLAARTGAVIKTWKPTPLNPNNPYSLSLNIDDLLPLLTSHTRIVAFTACSNILGSLVHISSITKSIRTKTHQLGCPKLEISIDCVAYAPHRLMDVQAWDIDYCVFSYYKVYGPHVSALYVRQDCLVNSVQALTHHFLPVVEKGYKLMPGGPGYELVYGTTGVIPYLLGLSGTGELKDSFEAIAKHEQTLVQPLLAFLTAPEQWERGVRVVGDEKPSLNRVPTISFVVVGPRKKASKDIVAVFDSKDKVGIRYGHFYAYTLVSELPDIDPADGVVRISLVHYNTVDEVERCIEILKEALA